MKFENTEVWGFNHAIRGMRNPMNSWGRSDSQFDGSKVVIGENDMRLAQKLILGGAEHRKFLRQIFVSVDITAPLYWWKEMDTYKVGTTANSTSTMHKLTSSPITIECFETDDYLGELEMIDPAPVCIMVDSLIDNLEQLRQRYIQTKDKKYWKELVRWLPESWLQTRTVTMTYENILNMCNQRKNHKLNEWSGLDNNNLDNLVSWARELPYAQEFIFINELEGA